ncbi:hypothetical protein [Sediminicola luteus]|uniref:Uncharacterized protein n=1 Tax=Sediminicola luteus TaxID=319238 RepID=A0A2A4GD98_9FLAO|nr:hypothetical protein [Sediminicola luteus]PCE65755.1 hypothetical protein B7P33_00160 [Sediminicola luteus]
MKKWFPLVLVLAFIGCDSDDLGGGAAQLDLVTGIWNPTIVPEEGFVLGNPNVRNLGVFTIKPNPADNEIQLSSDQNISKVYLVLGKPLRKYKEVDFATLLNADLYTEAEIRDKAVSESPSIEVQPITISFEDLAPGYYRVFVQIEGQFYWDNAYVSKEAGFDIQTLVDFWSE